MNHSTKKEKGRAVTSVKVPTAEGYNEVDTEAAIFANVCSNLSDRVCLVFTAPCCNGPLIDDIVFWGTWKLL